MMLGRLQSAIPGQAICCISKCNQQTFLYDQMHIIYFQESERGTMRKHNSMCVCTKENALFIN